MTASHFFDAIGLLRKIRTSQAEPIRRAAEACADSIGTGKLVHTLHVEVNLNLPREGSAREPNDVDYALWRRRSSR